MALTTAMATSRFPQSACYCALTLAAELGKKSFPPQSLKNFQFIGATFDKSNSPLRSPNVVGSSLAWHCYNII
jgi:hypothetical protein